MNVSNRQYIHRSNSSFSTRCVSDCKMCES
nr:MAG TPA: Radical SAM superfamily [Caudoviricetes sp.]